MAKLSQSCAICWMILFLIIRGLNACLAETTANRSTISINPFQGDVRMEAPTSFAFHDKSMLDFLADLEETSGIEFFPDKSVTEVHFTLIAHNLPLGQILQSIAAFFHFTWERETMGKRISYRLYQTSEQQQAQAAELAKEEAGIISQPIDALQEELRVFREVDKYPDSQLLPELNALNAQLLSAQTPSQARQIRLEMAVIRNMLQDTPGLRFVYRFLCTLTTSQLNGLFHVPFVTFQRHYIQEVSDIPLSVIAGYPFAKSDPFTPPDVKDAKPTKEYVNLSISFENFTPNSQTLHWYTTLVSDLGEYAPNMQRGQLPSPMFYGSVHDEGESTPPSLQSPDLNAKISLISASNKTRVSLGDELLELDKVHSINVIADSFWDSTLPPPNFQNEALSTILTQLAVSTNHEATLNAPFVFVKSPLYALKTAEEPPAEDVKRWEKEDQNESWNIDTFADMCSLPDLQYATLKKMVLQWPIVPHMEVLDSVRPVLKFWHALNGSQRNEMKTTGLAYSSLSPSLQNLFALACNTISDDITITPGDLNHAVCSVVIGQTPGWGYRKEGVMNFIENQSQDQALIYFQQTDPTITKQNIRPYVSVSVNVSFSTPEKMLAQTMFLYYQSQDTSDAGVGM
jgi:hypothetical protein